MIPFAVKVKGLHAPDENRAAWVLAIEGDRFLMVAEDKSFEWVPIADCELLKATTPDQPRLVIAIPPPEPVVAIPSLNLPNGRKV